MGGIVEKAERCLKTPLRSQVFEGIGSARVGIHSLTSKAASLPAQPRRAHGARRRGQPLCCRESIGTAVQMAGGRAESLVAYARPVSSEQAAQIFWAGDRVWSGLRHADPQPHQRIAVVGIGGLGHLAVQYAKAAGFHTIAVSHPPAKKPSSSAPATRTARWPTPSKGFVPTAASCSWTSRPPRCRCRPQRAFDRVASGDVRVRAVIVHAAA